MPKKSTKPVAVQTKLPPNAEKAKQRRQMAALNEGLGNPIDISFSLLKAKLESVMPGPILKIIEGYWYKCSCQGQGNVAHRKDCQFVGQCMDCEKICKVTDYNKHLPSCKHYAPLLNKEGGWGVPASKKKLTSQVVSFG